jgi:hypothetical protein
MNTTCAVIDLETTLGKIGHQPAHGKILPTPLHQPFALRAAIATFDDCPHHTLTMVVRIASSDPCWPPSQPAC